MDTTSESKHPISIGTKQSTLHDAFGGGIELKKPQKMKLPCKRQFLNPGVDAVLDVQPAILLPAARSGRKQNRAGLGELHVGGVAGHVATDECGPVGSLWVEHVVDGHDDVENDDLVEDVTRRRVVET